MFLVNYVYVFSSIVFVINTLITIIVMFDLVTDYKPTGDQPQAIEKLTSGLDEGSRFQTLLGITGSGKTFTMANIIARYNRPTLILSHNKTLAAQLYNEIKSLFPNNLVEYYVSYYDYFKPESYLPASNVYIAKTLKINHRLEKLRMGAIVSLLTERSDVIVVSSVSCIYGIENPSEFKKSRILLRKGDLIDLKDLVFELDNLYYEKSDIELTNSQYRLLRDGIDVYVSHDDIIFRVIVENGEIVNIYRIDPMSGGIVSEESEFIVFSKMLFSITRGTLDSVLGNIEKELEDRVEYFESVGKHNEALRIRERTEYDISMIREMGYCSGIENYSLHFEGRKVGEPSACLFDYFPKDYLLLVDESHVTIPQIKAMYEGDKCRKRNLIDNGFRLPSAYDHRPLKFDEFETKVNKCIFISATPGNYEIRKSDATVEQLIRPTGLLDPEIEVRPSRGQIDDIISEINKNVALNERVFITTLTKKMAEELNVYLVDKGIKSQYLHSSVKTLDRVKILENLEKGVIDVVVGVNLLREGIDIPEVSLVIILDADKEGFLRNVTSLIQTIGRAARNVHGRVILYGDIITDSMRIAIDETNRRRNIQMKYNEENNIIPKSTKKIAKANLLTDKMDEKINFDFDEVDIKNMSKKQINKLSRKIKKEMHTAAKNLNFIKADKLKEKLEYINTYGKK